MNSKKNIFSITAALVVCFTLFSAKPINSEKYRCLPCGLECDGKIYDAPGTCPVCHMDLVKAASITFNSIEPADVCDYLASHPNAVLLDVRTEEEFSGKADPDFGTLKNAVNIPLQSLPARLPEIEKYKNRDIVVYCSHSHRSPQAAYLLTQNGFMHVTNMTGGMSVFADGPCKK